MTAQWASWRHELAEKTAVGAVVYGTALVVAVLLIRGGLPPARVSVVCSLAVALVIPLSLWWRAVAAKADRHSTQASLEGQDARSSSRRDFDPRPTRPTR